MKTTPQDLGYGVSLIDLAESEEQGRTAAYVVRGERKTALLEVGSSHAAPNILHNLEALGIQPTDIEYVIVTHIHLDHSGGVGYLLPHFPNATVLCHPRAARHLIDPTRLIAGASAVYGENLERIFGQILPVPEARVRVMQDGETLDLGGRIFTFYDTPGHARHHFSIHDSGSQGIFTGDTVSIRYVPELTGWDFTCLFPSTSPSEFDREAVFQTVERLQALHPERIYHTHFGVTEPASYAFERTLQTVADYDTMAREIFRPGLPWEDLAERIREYIRQDLASQGHAVQDLHGLELDIRLNAQGLLFVLEKEYAKNNS